MLRSLRARLLLLTLPVAIVSVLATAFVTNRTTRATFTDALERDLESERVIFENLGNYAAENGTWQGADRLIRKLHDRYEQRIALTDINGQLLADSEQIVFGRNAEVPSGRPLLIEPTDPLFATGYTKPQLAQLRASVQRILDCLDEADVPYTVADGEYRTEEITVDISDPAVLEISNNCSSAIGGGQAFVPSLTSDESFVERTLNAPGKDFDPARLYFGQAAASPDTVGSGFAWRLPIAIAGVLLITVAAALAVSQRILRPVFALTTAAKQMEAGEFDARVPVRRDDELGDLGRAFNSMSESLGHSITLRRRMTSDVAHELRTPISNIRGYLEAAQDGIAPLTPELVDSLYEDTIHLQQLVEDLQEISIADAGQIRLDTQIVDLDHLVEQSVVAHQARAIAEGIHLSRGQGVGGRLEIDSRRVRQVLVNLIENAIRYTDRGGSVTVSCSRRPGAALVTVSDTGTGIGTEHLPHIFERFYRADESRSRDTGGTGLGLAIAQQLISAHGGMIHVESTLGTGSVFTIELPTSASAAATNGTGPSGTSTRVRPPTAPSATSATSPEGDATSANRDESIVIDEVIHLDGGFSRR